MLSRTAREATFVLPEGYALPGQTALLFKDWLDKENVSMQSCDLSVSSDLAAGKTRTATVHDRNGSRHHCIDICV